MGFGGGQAVCSRLEGGDPRFLLRAVCVEAGLFLFTGLHAASKQTHAAAVM